MGKSFHKTETKAFKNCPRKTCFRKPFKEFYPFFYSFLIIKAMNIHVFVFGEVIIVISPPNLINSTPSQSLKNAAFLK